MAPARQIPRRAIGGFTLIELMVTLVLFGVMVGLAAPAMSGMVNHYRIDRTVSQLSADVMYARMLAVRSGQPVELVLQADRYRVQRTNPTTVVKQVNLGAEHPGMQLSTGTMVFNSRGLLTEETDVSTITVTRAGRSQTLTVLPTGRIHHAY